MPFKQRRLAFALAALLAVVAACSSGGATTEAPTDAPAPSPSATAAPTPGASATATPTPAPEEPTPSSAPTRAGGTDAGATPTATPDQQIPEPPVLEGRGKLMLTALDEVIFRSETAALREIRMGGDPSYIPALVELLRFKPLFRQELTDSLLYTLDTLAAPIDGSEFSTKFTWSEWVMWLASYDVEPPEGFAAWKGYLYTLVDPAWAVFFYADLPTRINIGEVVWGGVRKDGIPDLIDPPVVSPDEATYLNPDDRVFGVSINGEHRAYPHRIMNPHEMANDVVGGAPIALAY